MNGVRRTLPALLALTALVAGCARADRVESDPHWPIVWRGLTLYRHEGELAYATSSGAAAEVCTRAREVADVFRERTGAEPVPWIHIALDRGDPTLLGEPGRGFDELLLASAEHQGGERPQLEPGMRERVADEDLISLVPLVLAVGTVGPRPEPGAGIGTVTLLATSGRIGRGLDAVIDAGMEAEGVNFFQRLVLAPILPFVKRSMGRRLENLARYALYRYQVAALADLDESERYRLIDEYEVELGLLDEPDPAEWGIEEPD